MIILAVIGIRSISISTIKLLNILSATGGWRRPPAPQRDLSLSLSIYIYTEILFFIHTCICIYIYIYIHTPLSLSLYMCIYIYIYMHMYIVSCLVSSRLSSEGNEGGPKEVGLIRLARTII